MVFPLAGKLIEWKRLEAKVKVDHLLLPSRRETN